MDYLISNNLFRDEPLFYLAEENERTKIEEIIE